MEFKDRTHRALGVAILVWTGSVAALAVAGLATGVWRLSDLWGRAGAAFLSEFGLVTIVGTFLLVGGPVFLWKRYGLVAPIIGLACYVAYWTFLGILTGAGVSALYVGSMYGLFALVGIAVLTVLEWTLRAVRLRWLESAGYD
ncbi:MAG TPA: hypothetical protein VFJ06_07025 [Halococcus sp.]|nr:hypothetical protein [Halococcus sp.]